MLIEETITSLEMTSPEQLRPGRLPPAPLELVEGDPPAAPLLRSTCTRVGEPHGWVTRPQWSDEQWPGWLAEPGVHAWVARVGGEVAGMVELEARAGGEVEITIFGLVPEFVGRGFGGHLLTLATRLAWEVRPPDGTPTRRCGCTPRPATMGTPSRTTRGGGSACSGPRSGGGRSSRRAE